MTLAERYAKLCATPSSINELLPVLRRYAEQVSSIAEFGVDIGQSTTAFLMAQPQRLLSFDVVQSPTLGELFSCADSHMTNGVISQYKFGNTYWYFILQDSRKANLEPVDLLFIDSAHCYDVIKAELERHASNVRRWIICHDTVSFGQWGEAGEPQVGIGPAITEFLAAHPEWVERERFDFNNGLLVMERV